MRCLYLSMTENYTDNANYQLGICTYSFFRDFLPEDAFNTILLNQKFPLIEKNVPVSIYSLNLQTDELMITKCDDYLRVFKIEFTIDELEINMIIPTHEQLQDFLKINTNRYLFIDISYENSIANVNGHQSLLVLDTKLKRPILLDPNGAFNYDRTVNFNNIMKLLDLYFLDFQHVQFENTTQLTISAFNTKKPMMKEYDLGNCVICSRIIKNLIHDNDTSDEKTIITKIEDFIEDRNTDITCIYNYITNTSAIILDNLPVIYDPVINVIRKEISGEFLSKSDVDNFLGVCKYTGELKTYFIQHFKTEMVEKYPEPEHLKMIESIC
jgi:hypothetical protein